MSHAATPTDDGLRHRKEYSAIPQLRKKPRSSGLTGAAPPSVDDFPSDAIEAPFIRSESTAQSVHSFRSRKHRPAPSSAARSTSAIGNAPTSGAPDPPYVVGTSTSNTLRRKAPVIGQHVEKSRSGLLRGGAGLSIRTFKDVSGLSPPELLPRSATSTAHTQEPRIVPSAQPRAFIHREVPEIPSQPFFHSWTPLSDMSTTPSMRYDSPGGFSHTTPTSVTTPTSLTGFSPLISQSPHFGPGYATTSPLHRKQPGSSRHQPRVPEAIEASREVRPQTNVMAVASQGPKPLSPKPMGTRVERGPQRRITISPPMVIRPPELAHLEEPVVAPPHQQPGTPPMRPSRIGVKGLVETKISNPPYLYGLDTSSEASRSHRGSKHSPSKEESSRKSQPQPRSLSYEMSPPVARQPTDRMPVTVLSSELERKARMAELASAMQPKTTPAAMQIPTLVPKPKPPSRFGFFHRKDKTASPAYDEERVARMKKGPSAGTGHEGYGKFTSTRRTPRAFSAKRTSAASILSTDNDDFLTRKRAPVFPGKDSEGHVTQSDRSSSGLDGSRTSHTSYGWSPATSQASLQPPNMAFDTRPFFAMEDAAPSSHEVPGRGSTSRSRGASIAVLAGRPRKLPKEPKHKDIAKHLGMPVSTRQPELPQPYKNAEAVDKATEKKSGLRSFFGFGSRTKSGVANSKLRPPERRIKDDVPMSPLEPLKMPTARVAHYDILDNPPLGAPSNEVISAEELDQLLKEAASMKVKPPSHGELSSKRVTRTASKLSFVEIIPVKSFEADLMLSPGLQQQHIQRMPITSTVAGRDEAYRVSTHLPDAPGIDTPLAERTSGDEARSVPNFSHGRPYAAQGSPRSTQAIAEPPDQGPRPRNLGHMAHEHNSQQQARRSHRLSKSLDSGHEQVQRISRLEAGFMSMGRSSDVSISSSSGSFWFPVPASTAPPQHRRASSSPDEVWDEYDEFIDKVITPFGSSLSVDKSSGPDYFAETPRIREGSEQEAVKTKTAFPRLSGMAASLRSDLSPFLGTEKRSPQLGGLVHPALRSTSPSPPESSPKADLGLAGHSLIRRVSARSKLDPSSHPSKVTKPIHLSLAALDVSKWLTFDQVLVSPAHDDLVNSQDDKVLVVDGLGKEWAQFCARSYPKTQIFGLSPAPYDPRLKGQPSPPPNYRHVRSSSLAVSFPFPQNTFQTVVFRFPLATSECSLDRAISECKRVLRPGGYIEVFVLDLDFAVMGPKTRRTIKSLKTRLQDRHPDICLKPTSDYIQYLLGKHGLDNLNRCVIGSPVAGPITNSPTSSRDEPYPNKGKARLRDEATPNERVKNLAPSVGRWWYSQIYEQKASSPGRGNTSIWDDAELLKECKERAAAFKLLVCYAQKPIVNKRKTKSL